MTTNTVLTEVSADPPTGKMRRWYMAGDSNATIGRRLALHQSKVRRVLLEADLTMRSRREHCVDRSPCRPPATIVRPTRRRLRRQG
jgi:hypothetical protein